MAANIAQFIIPSDSIGNPYQNASGGCIVDWEVNQRVYLYNNIGIRSYSIASFGTQNPILSQTFPTSGVEFGCCSCTRDGYPLVFSSGDNVGSHCVIRKFDPNTLTTLSTWGGAAYPNGLIALNNQIGACMATIMVNSVPYALGEEILGNNGGIFRTDTMTAAGWYGPLKTSGAQGAFITGGQTGGSSQGTFYACDYNNSGSDTTLAITKITINSSASSYNIASWPTANPGITAAVIATLTPTQIDPTWTTIQSISIGYDNTDNILVLLLKQFSGSGNTYFVGMNPSGSIVWITQAPVDSTPDLSQSISKLGQLYFLGNGSPTTASGVVGANGYIPPRSSFSLTGLGNSYRAYFNNDILQSVIGSFTYNSAGANVAPAAGTASSFSGWAMLSAWPNNFTVGSQIWFRRNGGIWNNNPLADPATGVGGLDMSITRSCKMFVIGKGADVTLNFNFGAGSFSYSVPAGFTAGWPAAGGGWSSFDSTKNYGSAALSNSNTTLSCPTTYGACASIDGWYEGKYYFEYTNVFNSFFSNFGGSGVMRYELYPPTPTAPNFWGDSASNTSNDPNGGGSINDGTFNTFEATAHVPGGSVANMFQVLNGDIISVAVVLVAQNVPQVYQTAF